MTIIYTTHKWEYYVTFLPLDTTEAAKELDEFGKTGWELVNVVPCSDHDHARAYLKRNIGTCEIKLEEPKV